MVAIFPRLYLHWLSFNVDEGWQEEGESFTCTRLK